MKHLECEIKFRFFDLMIKMTVNYFELCDIFHNATNYTILINVLANLNAVYLNLQNTCIFL